MKNYELQYGKDDKPATYKQLKWLLSYDNVSCNINISQLMKRFPMSDFYELIETAKRGEKINIID